MKGRCLECGASLTVKKCDYCGAEGRKKAQDKAPLNSAQQKVLKEARRYKIVSLLVYAIVTVIGLLIITHAMGVSLYGFW